MIRWLIRFALVGYFGLFLLVTAGLANRWAHSGPPPEQPIDFPHTTHAGRLGLACTFCHQEALRSPQAGAPPIEKCMSCHQTLALDSPEVQKLHRHQRNKEPVIWKRIHSLPSHVYFTHKRHIQAGIDCSACHGAVSKMERVSKVRPLTMGWCVRCHRYKGAPTDCATCHQ